MANKEIKAKFLLEKETRNTYRFTEVDAQGVKVGYSEMEIGTLYLRKKYFDREPRGIIEITLTVDTGNG
jgi:hypothetical protein